MGDTRAGRDRAIAADPDIGADHGTRADQRSRTDLGARPDHGAGLNRHAVFKARIGMDMSAWADSRATKDRRRPECGWKQRAGCLGEGTIRLPGDKEDQPLGRLIGEVRVDETCTRARRPEYRGVGFVL